MRSSSPIALLCRTVARAAAGPLLVLPLLVVPLESESSEAEPPLAATSGMQSPIDLPAAPRGDESHHIAIHYIDSAEHVIHRDHTIEVEYDPGSELVFDDSRYTLKQLHFHTPSEHLVTHERFPMELHLVHRNDEGQLLVMAVLFEIGAPNAFIERILRDTPSEVGRIDLDRHLDVTRVFPEEKHFYTYLGSLTTPPYTEGVRWLILTEHPSVSPEQVVRLLVLEGGNARDVQPVNARPIDGL